MKVNPDKDTNQINKGIIKKFNFRSEELLANKLKNVIPFLLYPLKHKAILVFLLNTFQKRFSLDLFHREASSFVKVDCFIFHQVGNTKFYYSKKIYH